MKAVSVSDVSKKFNIGFKKDQGALSRLISAVSDRGAKKEIQVLKNISFEVSTGEVFGLVGRNGSGKSTLLRIIAGIYCPDSGRVFANGRVDYLSGLNNGLSSKLTMKENIFLMGSLIGLNRKQISDRFDEIVEFSGLEDFVYTKVYQFSSGMLTRLGFSTTMHCLNFFQSDVLLLDEIFGSGGDIDFEEKAGKKMAEFINGGAAVILASHDLQTVKNYCHKVILLDKGEVIDSGSPEEVVKKYLNL